MKKILSLGSLFAASLMLTACATTPKNSLAIQKENNQYEVTGIGKTNIISKIMLLVQLTALVAVKQLL